MPILLTMTAGTALGAWLTTNQPLIWVLFTLIFVISLVGAFRWLSNPEELRIADCGLRNERKKSEIRYFFYSEIRNPKSAILPHF